ncbi:hypothetical protein AX17_003039 [Amanita inopinata Kibby_2008]|nr:hypothetical protein AX17_003039 [Amanita inopinata Kibby_2008]
MADTQPSSTTYDQWTREDFIQRITQLESKLRTSTTLESGSSKAPQKPTEKEFQFSAYPRRKIALKFCYSGWEYNGLAYQSLPTPLPTVEGVLFDALVKARMVDPEAGFEGCGWEKCGRTDRGVSAAGQVVSLWVRSAIIEYDEREARSQPKPSSSASPDTKPQPQSAPHDDFGSLDISPPSSPSTKTRPNLPKYYKPEHDYVAILNRLLPSTIRVLAWSPVSPNFSARFSCQYRHYKYFFPPQGLDIDQMRAAACRIIGEHDFRNLCKLDPTKQITMFKRKITSVTIEPVDIDHPEDIYVFNLIGSAFLYHQVRHIMAILFLVGAGLEHPSVITSLLNVSEGAENPVNETDPPLQVVNGRPEYQMADALPLILWKCGYKPEDVDWRINGHTDEKQKEGMENTNGDLCHALESIYARSRVFATLNQHFLTAAEQYHRPPTRFFPLTRPPIATEAMKQPMHIPLGGGTYKRTLRYTPLLDRVRMDPVDVVNERWRNGKGLRREERRKAEAEDDE